MAQSAAHFERPAQRATKPRVKQETRSVLKFIIACMVVDSTEQERHYCNGEFEQLHAVDVHGGVYRFKVRAVALGMCTSTVLTIDIRTARFSLSICTYIM